MEEDARTRLNKPLALAAVVVALILGLVVGGALDIGKRLFGGPDPETVASSALHSMRAAHVSRFYLQVDAGTDLADWSDDWIWEALATRLGHGQDGWHLHPGPITDKSVLPMRSFVMAPMRYGQECFLAHRREMIYCMMKS